MSTSTARLAICPRCGATNPSLASGVCLACMLRDDELEFALEGFQIERELGKGGMGTVYLARQLRLDRTVAVKVISPEVAQHAESRARFEREARLLAKLKHPHIVTIHDYGEQDGSPYLVMEHIEGSALSGATMSPSDAVSVMSQVCDALAYAHGRGVIHRDIKPSNILLDTHNRAKVVDFGIARVFGDDDHNVTRSGVLIGTPSYMAPELQAGTPPDPRADIYSAGLVLFKLVTGRLPVGDLSVPMQGLEAILRKALAAEPAARFQKADEFAAELRSCGAAASRALTARDPIRVKSRKLWLVPLLALFTSIAIVATIALTGSRDESASGDSRDSVTRDATPRVSTSDTADAAIDSPIVDRDPAPTVAPLDAAVKPAPQRVTKTEPKPPKPKPPTKPAKPPPVEPPAPGTIAVFAKPWAEVTIDGRRQRRAEPPFMQYVVPSGRRRLEFYNPNTNKRDTRIVDVVAGSNHDVNIDLR